MITKNSVALRFETRNSAGAGCRVRAVLVQEVITLGDLGTFALIRSGLRDGRRFAGHHEAESEAVDVRELLPLAWLENFPSRSAKCATYQNCLPRSGEGTTLWEQR